MSQPDDTSEIAPQSEQPQKIHFTSFEKPERAHNVEPTPPPVSSHSERQDASDDDTKAKPVDIVSMLYTHNSLCSHIL